MFLEQAECRQPLGWPLIDFTRDKEIEAES